MAKSLNVRNYIYGTNANVPTFPQGLDFAVRDCQKALFGMPFVMDEVREFVRRASQ